MAFGRKTRLFLLPYWKWVLLAVFLAVIALTIEFMADNLKVPITNWILTVSVVTVWAFVLWFSPRMVPIQLGCFPKANVRFNDGHNQDYSFLAERQDTLVLADSVHGNVLLVPLKNVTEVAIEECK
jgi:hypothetical protein